MFTLEALSLGEIRCPRCGGDQLDVRVVALVSLTRSSPDQWERPARFDEATPVWVCCVNCGFLLLDIESAALGSLRLVAEVLSPPVGAEDGSPLAASGACCDGSRTCEPVPPPGVA